MRSCTPRGPELRAGGMRRTRATTPATRREDCSPLDKEKGPTNGTERNGNGWPRGEIFGDVPNVAARAQALAEPGAVVVTAWVQRQVAGLFVAEERGSHELKRTISLWPTR